MLTTAPRDGAVAVARRPEASIDAAAVARAFTFLEKASGLLLAVSGGPDSMALMVLAARWAAARADPLMLHVATVDHGLRPESQSEAATVAAAAAAFGLPHATLRWAGPKPKTRVQERARAARYGLLADHARAIGASHVVTAHHADDQAETVLLRLGRGSGVAGLAGMGRCVSLAPDVDLARPLLDFGKAPLVAVCRAAGLDFVDDPSNRDPAFARGRLREEAARLAALGLDTAGLTRLSRRIARAEAALEAEVDRIEAGLVPDRKPGLYQVDLAAIGAVAEEIRLRLLRRAVAHIDATAPIRLERLETMASAFWQAHQAGRAYSATLAGTRVRLDRNRVLRVEPEAPRRRGLPRP